MNECELRRRVRDVGVVCDEGECVFWSKLGMSGESRCAVQYFRLLEPSGTELAEWLLSLKEHQIVQLLGEDDAATG